MEIGQTVIDNMHACQPFYAVCVSMGWGMLGGRNTGGSCIEHNVRV